MNKDIERLTRKIELKAGSGLKTDKEIGELKESLYERAKTSDTLAAALGTEERANNELYSFVGEAAAFPLSDLEKTTEYLEYKLTILEKLMEQKDTDKAKIKDTISEMATAQWHFNEISKPLTSEYLTSERASSYMLLSPYIDYDIEDMKAAAQSYKKVLAETKEVLANKDMKRLYKCNADIITLNTNLTLIRYKIC